MPFSRTLWPLHTSVVIATVRPSSTSVVRYSLSITVDSLPFMLPLQVLALRKKLGENLAVVMEFPNSLEAR